MCRSEGRDDIRNRSVNTGGDAVKPNYGTSPSSPLPTLSSSCPPLVLRPRCLMNIKEAEAVLATRRRLLRPPKPRSHRTAGRSSPLPSIKHRKTLYVLLFLLSSY